MTRWLVVLVVLAVLGGCVPSTGTSWTEVRQVDSIDVTEDGVVRFLELRARYRWNGERNVWLGNEVRYVECPRRGECSSRMLTGGEVEHVRAPREPEPQEPPPSRRRPGSSGEPMF